MGLYNGERFNLVLIKFCILLFLVVNLGANDALGANDVCWWSFKNFENLDLVNYQIKVFYRIFMIYCQALDFKAENDWVYKKFPISLGQPG